ncbi:MAG: VacB/RNase II family 3'-5' exoribonuclease, partial [Candidatus Auribacterota bacterium]|nr:VacB/RNase II family 3'-5' exoribonuclease [Candidatus Auribacterota bacterium]
MKKEKIIRVIKSKKNKPLTRKDIARILHIRTDGRKSLYRMLEQMERSGEIVRVKNNRYAIPKELGLTVGKLEVNPRGFGFVIPAAGVGEDIYIHKEDMFGALHGDTVLVRLKQSRGRRRKGKSLSGSIIRVVREGTGGVVGTLNKKGSRLFMVPDNPSFNHNIYIDPARKKGARPGDKITVKIITRPSRSLNPEGEVVEVLGKAGMPEVDTLSAIRQYDLREEYPVEALAEVKNTSGTISPGEIADRLDLRKKILFTVDPEDARDFDDAVSLEKNKDGTIVLGVHIADVSHYVREDSAIGEEARERGTSVYLPSRALHMLPPGLSTGICSLRPGEERLTKSVLITFSPEGKRLKYKFYRSVINSRRRYTYDEVRKILVDKDESARRKEPELTERLDAMAKLARLLRAARFTRGAFDLDMPEARIIFDDKGLISDIRLEEADLSHWLIEEFMLAANESAADFLTEQKAALIYRVHEEPDDEDLYEFMDFAAAFGYKIKNPRDRTEIQNFLDSVRETPLATTLQTAFLRSMKQAEYSEKNIGHFGLASPRYTYFTSPIRRYPDL